MWTRRGVAEPCRLYYGYEKLEQYKEEKTEGDGAFNHWLSTSLRWNSSGMPCFITARPRSVKKDLNQTLTQLFTVVQTCLTCQSFRRLRFRGTSLKWFAKAFGTSYGQNVTTQTTVHVDNS
ncbi:hypothetical protein M404DRAFT_994167 [Pisolithus tinctorius Marx 270]|uniref:Uncharacterized protein n=1 Tax=Pisolithus tinctorius Marx 270 TaxID=870435 RepID=A0A0C3PEG8_PISTI|nr:hypothetical protein M404DRAFT_994167 [Pisolithus tinctorius Marx 270]